MRISVRSTPDVPAGAAPGTPSLGISEPATARPRRRGRRSAHAHRVADGRDVLPRAVARRARVRLDRRRRLCWPDALHPRGDEAHERGEGGRRGRRARDPRRERGRVEFGQLLFELEPLAGRPAFNADRRRERALTRRSGMKPGCTATATRARRSRPTARRTQARKRPRTQRATASLCGRPRSHDECPTRARAAQGGRA